MPEPEVTEEDGDAAAKLLEQGQKDPCVVHTLGAGMHSTRGRKGLFGATIVYDTTTGDETKCTSPSQS